MKTADWLIGGRKKGEFFAKHGSDFTIPLVLSPVREGRLFIPSVKTSPLPHTFEAQQHGENMPSCETNHNNAATSIMVIQQDSAKANLWIDRTAGDIVVVS